MKKVNESISDDKKVKTIMRAAAGVIVRYKDGNPQVLLIQRHKNDHWPLHFEFPRGKCDKFVNEEITHCLKREVKEETGLDVKIVKKIDIHVYLADGGERKTYCHNFLCILNDPNQKIKLSKEHQDFMWVSEVGELELLIMPEQKKTIEKVLNSDRSIVSYPTDKQYQVVDEYISYLNEIEPASLAITYTTVALANVLFSVYKNYFSKFARQCDGLIGIDKRVCILSAKAKAKKMEAEKIKATMNKCNKVKNPEKCIKIFKNKLSQANAVYSLSNRRARELGKK